MSIPRLLRIAVFTVLTWSAPAFAASQIPLNPGATYGSTLAEPGEQDVFVFSGTSGQRLHYDALDGDFDPIQVRLIGPGGNLVHLTGGNADQDIGPFTLVEAGTYALVVYAPGDVTGDYQFRLLDLAASPALTLGTPVVGQLPQRTETHVFQFNGTNGQRVRLDSVSVGGPGFHAGWSLVSPAQVTLASGSLATDLGDVTLPVTGPYFLFVAGNVLNPTPLAYEVLCTDVSEAPVPVAGLDVERSGALLAGETYSTNFTAPAGLQVYFDSLDRGGTSLLVEVLDPSGATVFSIGQTADAGPFVLPRSGTHTLRVRGNSPTATGLYRFRLLNLATRPLLPLDAPLNATLTTSYQTDVYQLPGTVGQRFFYDALDADDDQVFVRLRTPDGNFRIPNQNADRDFGTFTLPMSGTYHLFVESSLAGSPDYRFQFFDLATRPTLPFDTDLNGTLDPGRSVRIQTFGGSPGQTLYFDGRGSDSRAYWAIFTPNDGLLDAPRLTSDTELVLPNAGTYALVLAGEADSPIAYTNRVVTFTLTTNAVVFGATVTGSIAESGEQDVYTFTGTVGQRLFYDALEADYDPIFVRLYDPSGVIAHLNGNADADVGPFTLTQAGTFRLVVDGSAGTTGDYSFRLLDLATQPALPLDTDLVGTLDPGRSVLIYTLTGTPGQTLYADGRGGDSRAVWGLAGPGNVYGEIPRIVNDFEQTLTLPGTHALVLSGDGDSPVTYSNRVVTFEYVTNALTLGATAQSTIAEAGEQDIYTFTGTAGQRLFYDALDGDFDPIAVRLFDPAGVLVHLNGNADNDVGPFTLSASGTYRLIIDGTGNTTGDYGFRLLDLAAQPALPFDTDLVGTLDPGRSVLIYTFAGTPGQTLYADGRGGDFRGVWGLAGPGNAYGEIPRIVNDFEQTLTLPGTHALVLSGDGDSPVTYSNRVVTFEYVTNALTLGATAQSTIAEAGEQDIYTFTGTAEQRLFYDALDGDFDPIAVRLFDPAGAIVHLNGNADTDVGPFTLSASGTYRLIIDGTGNTTGDYGFRLLDLAAQPALPLDTDLVGTLDPGRSVLIYTFAGTPGQTLYFDARGGDTRGVWAVANPLNAYGDIPRIVNDFEQTLTRSGMHALVLSGDGDSPVVYTNRVVTFGYSTNGLAFGTTVDGTIAEAGEQDVHTFTGTAGQRLFYDALDGDGEPIYVRLVDPEGTIVHINGYSETDVGPFALARSGQYRLVVDASGDATGDYSFRLHDLATTPALTLGVHVAGQLATRTETDLYGFTGATGQRVHLDSLSASAGQAQWLLVGPANQLLATGSILSDLGDVALPAPGRYSLLVQGLAPSGTPIDYDVLLSDVSDAPVAVSGLGIERSGAILAGETNTTTFTGPAGLPVFFDSMDRGGTSLYIDLLDPTGLPVTSPILQTADAGPFVLPRSGTYTVHVRGYIPSATGLFRFRFLDLSAAPAVALGTSTTLTLDPGYKTDVHRLAGGAGQRLYYDALQSDPDAVGVRMVIPSGAIAGLNHNSDTDVGPFSLPVTGNYYVMFESNQASPADYGFKLIDLGAQPVLPLDTPATNTLAVYESAFYRHAGSVGQRLFFDALGATGSGGWYLYSPGDQYLDGSGSLAVNFDYDVTVDGTHLLGIFNTGAGPAVHSFQVVSSGVSTQALILGASINTQIGEPGELDYYSFTGTAGQRFVYDALQANPAPIYVQLLNSAGSVVHLNQDADTDTAPFTLLTSGTYRLVVYGQNDTTGSYGFRLLDVKDLPVLPFDLAITNALAPYEAAVYRVPGTAGQRLFFDALGATGSGGWYFYAPNDPYLDGSGSVNVNFDYDLAVNGTYVLGIFSGSATSMTNAFQVVTAAVLTNALTFGAPVNAQIGEPGELQSYSFTGTAGQRFVYDALQGNPAPIHVQLLNPAGNIVHLNHDADNDGGPFTLAASGTYRLLFYGVNDATGGYGFRLIELNAMPVLPFNASTTNTLAPYEAAVYRIAGSAGQRLFFDALGTTGPGGWYFYSPNDAYLDGTANLAVNFDHDLTVQGTHLLGIFSTSATPITNVFQVVDSSVLTNALTLGASTDAQISEPGELDYYSFTGTAGQRFVYDALQANPAPIYVQLLNPAGSVVHLNQDADIDTAPFTLLTSGTYRLLFYGVNDTTGTYGFRLLDLNVQPALPLDTTVTNQMAPFEAVVYRHEGVAGQRLFFDALGATGPGGWYFYAPGDQYLDGTGNLNANFDHDLASGGRHVLGIFSAAAVPLTNVFHVVTLGDDPNVTANSRPVLAAIPEQVTGEEADLTFTATATDPNPADSLRFSLDAGAPAGAAIDPVTGVFHWTPPFTGFSGFTNLIVRVTDDGVPNLTDARIVTIKIIAGPILLGVVKSASDAVVTWRSAPGERYRLQYKNSLSESTWNEVTGNDIIATGFTAFDTDTNLGVGNERYYRVVFFPVF